MDLSKSLIPDKGAIYGSSSQSMHRYYIHPGIQGFLFLQMKKLSDFMTFCPIDYLEKSCLQGGKTTLIAVTSFKKPGGQFQHANNMVSKAR